MTTVNEKQIKLFELPNFNGKARVLESEGISRLVSYETEVARYEHETNKMIVNGWYSATTARHINSFLEFYGFDKVTKKEMLSWKS